MKSFVLGIDIFGYCCAKWMNRLYSTLQCKTTLPIINLISSCRFQMDISALLVGGVKPQFYCLSILKSETRRLALIEAATLVLPNSLQGQILHSAPHTTSTKESACGCVGGYFQGKLELLERF